MCASRVSEDSDVSVVFKRGGRTVKSGTTSGTGTRSLTVRGLKAGRYTVQVARDRHRGQPLVAARPCRLNVR